MERRLTASILCLEGRLTSSLLFLLLGSKLAINFIIPYIRGFQEFNILKALQFLNAGWCYLNIRGNLSVMIELILMLDGVLKLFK